jgi:hypothetical protein
MLDFAFYNIRLIIKTIDALRGGRGGGDMAKISWTISLDFQTVCIYSKTLPTKTILGNTQYLISENNFELVRRCYILITSGHFFDRMRMITLPELLFPLNSRQH